MIDVQEATRIAAEYFNNLYADEEFSDVLLEEVERTDEEAPYWFITLGYTDQQKQKLGNLVARSTGKRHYKRFQINAETGEMKAMKIRTVENA